MVPKNVSLFFIETLNALQQKKAEQKAINVTMENRLNFEKEKLNTAVGSKRLRQTQIDELVDYEAVVLADKKIARYIFCSHTMITSRS
jgi:predicted RNase H-like nuclease